MEGYIGQIIVFAGNYAPKGWMFCHGQTLSISEYTSIYAVIGTNYGGDGRVTFKLPDLRGRVVMSQGQSAGTSLYPLGAMGGYERVPIAIDNLPSHSHAIKAQEGSSGSGDLKVNSGAGNTNNPTNANSMASDAGLSQLLSTNDPATTIEGAVTNIQSAIPSTTEATGGSQSLYNVQPFQILHYIICINGLFPSRN